MKITISLSYIRKTASFQTYIFYFYHNISVFTTLEAAGTDMRHFARSKLSRSLVPKKTNWRDMINSLQVRTLILSKEVGYFFRL